MTRDESEEKIWLAANQISPPKVPVPDGMIYFLSVMLTYYW